MKKNYTAYPLNDLKFIPDGVRSTNPTDPPQFIEAKAYNTTELGPASNAGSQLKYLISWCIENQARCRDDLDPNTPTPSFELFITNEQMMSSGFQTLLSEAAERGVLVEVNGNPWP